MVFAAPHFDGEKLLRPAYFTVFWNGVLAQDHTASLGPTRHKEVAVYDSRETTGPIMLSAELMDPFSPAAGNVEYGYYVNATGYYVIWSNGTGRVNVATPAVTATGAVTLAAGATTLFVSNGSPQSN